MLFEPFSGNAKKRGASAFDLPGVRGVFRGVAEFDEAICLGVVKASGPGGGIDDSSFDTSGVFFSRAFRFSNSSGARLTIFN